jgi:acyl carrier protein
MPSDQVLEVQADAVEKVLAGIWQEFFKKDEVKPEDDFFALGGNSLLAVKFISKIEAHFGEEALPPEALYDDPSFANILAVIKAGLN